MNEIGKFYKPENVEQFYSEVVPVYQTAFAGEPWFEVSKCADRERVQRCVGGLSSLPLGQLCELCGNYPIRTAYEKDELINRFEAFAQTRPTAWYLEKAEVGITLAAIVWSATPETIADEKNSNFSKI